ncbi:hypothetical protein NIASO_08365 [Niabella soli DSM 19437]|uniref:Uncharacterized protein n=1 Tax=Niabella soli DSM 19437 TaxID=929713 RepID=W0F6M8_9BACT|nr:hypothetical protein NIASO_08365 [Niabella soli DSM 19437]
MSFNCFCLTALPASRPGSIPGKPLHFRRLRKNEKNLKKTTRFKTKTLFSCIIFRNSLIFYLTVVIAIQSLYLNINF